MQSDHLSPREINRPGSVPKPPASSRSGEARSTSIPADYGLRQLPLPAEEFLRVSRIVSRTCGIHLKDGKQDLVKARLGRRLRMLGLETFQEYFNLVEADQSGLELAEMVDLLTTNKTEFFRDLPHFEFLRREILPRCAGSERIRFWSAGCSTGQEPYSLAVIVNEFGHALRSKNCRILATDICRPALYTAGKGTFTEGDMEGMPLEYRVRYFSRTQGGLLQAVPALRRLIQFAHLNLVETWPMKGPFQLIMCRNVMIYFDRQTREKLVRRFWELLAPEGFLMVGLSESLTGLSHPFRYIQPAVYRKD